MRLCQWRRTNGVYVTIHATPNHFSTLFLHRLTLWRPQSRKSKGRELWLGDGAQYGRSRMGAEAGNGSCSAGGRFFRTSADLSWFSGKNGVELAGEWIAIGRHPENRRGCGRGGNDPLDEYAAEDACRHRAHPAGRNTAPAKNAQTEKATSRLSLQVR